MTMLKNFLNPGEKKDSIFRIFFVFISFSVALYFFMTLLFLIPKLDKTFDSLRNESDIEAVKSIAASLKQYIDDRRLSLTDISNNPIVSNAVLTGNGDSPAFRDYIKSVLLLGENPILTVLDVRGNILFSEFEENSDFQWALPIVNTDTQTIVNIVENREHPKFVLAIPIRYGLGKEGILVAYFNASPDNFNFDAKNHIGTSAIFLSKNGKTIRSDSWDAIEMPHEENIIISEYDVKLTHITSRHSVNEQKTSLLWGIGISSLFVALIGFALLFLLGRRIIVHPYEELAKVQQSLVKMNSELEEFSYRTSHDLKAPLVNIRGLSNIMQEDLDDGDYQEVSQNIQKVSDLTLKLENLIGDVVEAAKVSHENVEYEKVDIEKEVELIKEKLNVLIDEKRVSVQVNQNGNTNVWTEKALIQRVLENLISNAIKYSDPEKPERYVRVTVSEINKDTQIQISDNGLGIPEEYFGEVFGMFKRFHKSSSFGSGLGLYLVKKNLEKINGGISLESSPEGTVFTIVLPASSSIPHKKHLVGEYRQNGLFKTKKSEEGLGLKYKILF
jgi:signal transduction histidine kinase